MSFYVPVHPKGNFHDFIISIHPTTWYSVCVQSVHVEINHSWPTSEKNEKDFISLRDQRIFMLHLSVYSRENVDVLLKNGASNKLIYFKISNVFHCLRL